MSVFLHKGKTSCSKTHEDVPQRLLPSLCTLLQAKGTADWDIFSDFVLGSLRRFCKSSMNMDLHRKLQTDGDYPFDYHFRDNTFSFGQAECRNLKLD